MRDEGFMPVITASEINQHAFCARSWWLGRVKGYRSDHVRAMADGQSAHRAHGRIVVRSHHLQRLGYALLLLAGLVAVLGSYLLARGL